MGSVARRVFDFDPPDRFLAGTVGEPGDRSFYLQARKGDTLVTVGVEKAQVAVLAQRMEDLLEAVEAPAPENAEEIGELEEPVVELFRIGAMALAWDATSGAIVIEAQTPTADEADVEPDLLRVRLEPAQARSFVNRAEVLLGGGRPTCPFCGQPLDPQGHFCPRGNGQLN